MRARHAYDSFDTDSVDAGLDTSIVPAGEVANRTHQSFKDECDINTIVKRFGLTGELPTNLRMPEYGDYTGVKDFHAAVMAIQKAEENFMAMPADVRKEFDNDPQKFLDFCANPANLEKARALGLAPAKELAAAAAGIPGAAVVPPVAAPAGAVAPQGAQ